MFPPISSLPRNLLRLIVITVFAAGQSLTVPFGWADEKTAATLFSEKCARCHGTDGQGLPDGYAKPLRGRQSVEELVQLIIDTMPEDDPEDCVGDEARQLAEYIRKHLDSRDLGLEGPRLKLTRLTVEQYRNAVADVIGRFAPVQAPSEPEERRRRRRSRPPEPPLPTGPPQPPEPGLRGEYFQSRKMSKADRLGEDRIDGRIDFDFGEGSPAAGISADQFSIIWEGGLVANKTGHYEFRVSTQNGARLYLNLDPRQALRKLRDDSSAAGQQALIDAWVGSGKMRERSARVFLLGGRIYPLRLEFFKYLEETASVKLEWKPPHGVWAVLDHNHTTTLRPPRVYVCKTPFPADDRSLGFERGSAVSAEWHVATTDAALEAAAEVVDRLPLLADLTDEMADRDQRVKDFILRLTSTAFRRPLTSDEERVLVNVVLAEAPNLEAGVRRAILMVLMSPHFLYADLTPKGEPPSADTLASRLSFALWDSIPDQELLAAAENGQLETSAQIEAQARRMLRDRRAKAKMRSFFRHWLELDERDLAKDKQMFPEFDEAVIADLRRSLELFVEGVVWSRESDYRQLLLADYLLLNERLRQLYGPDLDGEARDDGGAGEGVIDADEEFSPSFGPVRFPADERSGVLTHPYLLSAYAYHNNTSPIHRGVFLTRNIVGRHLKPPPAAVAFKDNEFSPDLTMREKITQLTRDTACMSCHSVINPLGFALESFDAVGRFRTIDNDKPVNTRSRYTTVAGRTLELASARDVARFAVSSPSAHRAFVTQVFQHLVKQDPSAFGPGLIDELTAQFADDGFHVQNLWVRIAVTFATHNTPATPLATVR